MTGRRRKSSGLNPEDADLIQKIKKDVLKMFPRQTKADKKRIKALRKKAWESGLAAKDLNDLKPKKGALHFVEEDKDRRCYRVAVSMIRDVDMVVEFAYFCMNEWNLKLRKETKDTCGWVRGEPREEKFNTLGRQPLAGSSGYALYCNICGREICKEVLRRS
ncbi:MAG: hypothetical protein Q8Q06_04600 [bacterium]|nr:hypothetical protein [bacterium]